MNSVDILHFILLTSLAAVWIGSVVYWIVDAKPSKKEEVNEENEEEKLMKLFDRFMLR